MSEPKSQQEPSMEEILASIRRIISEDGTPEEGTPEDSAGEVPAEQAQSAEPEPVDPAEETGPEQESADEDVLDLTEVVDEGADIPAPVDLDASALDADAATGSEPSPEAGSAAQGPARTLEQGLLSAAAAQVSESQLSSLVAAVDRAHGGTPIGAGNRTIEDLVKEVMRPMIKDWLDSHLPTLVERMVRREVERLSRRAEGDE